MKLAIISPTGLTEKYSQPDYHMALAHLVLEDETYARYYQTMSRTKSAHVILDNSVIELGKPLSDSLLSNAVQKTMPDEFILPDFPSDPSATLEAARRWKLKKDRGHFRQVQFMGVPQWGYNRYLWEWFDSMQQLWTLVDTIGVPKFLREERINALRLIQANNLHNQKEFHLLGTWGNPIELKEIQYEFPWVRGADSKIPVRLGQKGVSLHPILGLVLEREALRTMELTHNSDPFPLITEWNIQLMKAWCEGRESPFGENTSTESTLRAL